MKTFVVEDGFEVGIAEAHEAIVKIGKLISGVFSMVVELVGKYREYLSKSDERNRKRLMYKLDLSRPKIQHQVIMRKPKLIRKIIK